MKKISSTVLAMKESIAASLKQGMTERQGKVPMSFNNDAPRVLVQELVNAYHQGLAARTFYAFSVDEDGISVKVPNILNVAEVLETMQLWLSDVESGIADLNTFIKGRAPGGIELNAKKMGMNVNREGNGIQMKFDPAMVEQFRKGDFTGIVPVIINMTPITNPAAILGMAESNSTAKS